MIRELISLALMCVVALLLLQHFGPWALFINIVVSLFILKVLDWLGIRVEINFWSLAIVIVGGIVGLLLVLFLSISGIAFSRR